MSAVLIRVEDLDLIRRMRAQQKAYFRMRKPTVLAEARDLERRVDAVLAEMANGQQKLLFEEGA